MLNRSAAADRETSRLAGRTANLFRGSGPGKGGHRPHSKCSKGAHQGYASVTP
jgi:hypothetical protein